jgi:hypothetical protein
MLNFSYVPIATQNALVIHVRISMFTTVDCEAPLRSVNPPCFCLFVVLTVGSTLLVVQLLVVKVPTQSYGSRALVQIVKSSIAKREE